MAMACDMMVVLESATGNQGTFFALNSHGLAGGRHLVLEPGKAHAAGEVVPGLNIELAQCRQTHAVLGYRSGHCWGFQHGVNEHGVVVGCSCWKTIVGGDEPGLTKTDLVRLGLERAGNARQAIDVLSDLLRHHGQGHDADTDAILLIADRQEAFAVETAGRFWALQEIGQLRTASDVGIIRQDWDRLSPGLSEYAIRGGHYPEDGSKLDFAGAVSADRIGQESALRRWGRGTVLLEGQNGHIDVDFLRRLLADHYEGTRFEVDPIQPDANAPVPICRHEAGVGSSATRISLVAELGHGADKLPLLWYAFGPPCLAVYFPVALVRQSTNDDLGQFLDRHTQRLWQLSAMISRSVRQDPDCRELVGERLDWLQARLDGETDEFRQTLTALRPGDEVSRQIQRFLQRHAELFENMVTELVRPAVTADALAWS
jgi:dipeptidase